MARWWTQLADWPRSNRPKRRRSRSTHCSQREASHAAGSSWCRWVTVGDGRPFSDLILSRSLTSTGGWTPSGAGQVQRVGLLGRSLTSVLLIHTAHSNSVPWSTCVGAPQVLCQQGGARTQDTSLVMRLGCIFSCLHMLEGLYFFQKINFISYIRGSFPAPPNSPIESSPDWCFLRLGWHFRLV